MPPGDVGDCGFWVSNRGGHVKVCTFNVCKPRLLFRNTIVKDHIPWLRDPNLRVQTLMVIAKESSPQN